MFTLIFLKLKRTSFVCMFLVTCRIRIRVGKLFYFGSAPQDLVSFFYALSRIWTVPRHCGERLRLPPPLPENTGHQLALQVQKIYSNGAYMSVYSCKKKKKKLLFYVLTLKKLKTIICRIFRAVQFGNWCMEMSKHWTHVPDRPFSLFEGLAGTIHYLDDLLEPDRARFPAFVF